MPDRLEELVSSLLYEGYALYPYTPEATKNATPTPFGIVYPPAYAAECAGAHDHARLEAVARPGTGARPPCPPPVRSRAPSRDRRPAHGHPAPPRAERERTRGPRATAGTRPRGARRADESRVRRRARHVAVRACGPGPAPLSPLRLQ